MRVRHHRASRVGSPVRDNGVEDLRRLREFAQDGRRQDIDGPTAFRADLSAILPARVKIRRRTPRRVGRIEQASVGGQQHLKIRQSCAVHGESEDWELPADHCAGCANVRPAHQPGLGARRGSKGGCQHVSFPLRPLPGKKRTSSVLMVPVPLPDGGRGCPRPSGSPRSSLRR